MAELSKYQKAVALAKSRGFSSPYAERKAKAKAAGFSSPRTQGRARGNKRDYQLEREIADNRAMREGFRNARDRAAFRKAPAGTNQETWQKARTLAAYGITESALNRMRKANRQYVNYYGQLQYSALNTYNLDIDRAVHDWTADRIGYIISFYGAITNPKTNYSSLQEKRLGKPDKNGNRAYLDRRKIDKRTGKPMVNKEHFIYMTTYGGMTIDEYETRYGTRNPSK